jgi:hypothetical protein
VALRSLGEHRLRDLTAAQQVFQVGEGTFPPLRSVDAVPTNLPTMRTELVGRAIEVATLAALIEHERLLTLTGVGGVGKTRRCPRADRVPAVPDELKSRLLTRRQSDTAGPKTLTRCQALHPSNSQLLIRRS